MQLDVSQFASRNDTTATSTHTYDHQAAMGISRHPPGEAGQEPQRKRDSGQEPRGDVTRLCLGWALFLGTPFCEVPTVHTVRLLVRDRQGQVYALVLDGPRAICNRSHERITIVRNSASSSLQMFRR